MSSSIDVAEHLQAATETSGHFARCELLVDWSERHAALVDLANQYDDFDVRMGHLTVAITASTAASSLSGRRMRISPSRGRTGADFLKPRGWRSVLIDPSSFWRARDQHACQMSIHMHSRVRWRR
jgi:hypothetical protein